MLYGKIYFMCGRLDFEGEPRHIVRTQVTPMSRVFSPPSETAHATTLREREALLIEKARQLTGTSYRRRSEIEEELADIHRLLKGLGFEKRTSI